MPFQAKDVFERVLTTLQDEGATRWTTPELVKHLNDGLREITSIKPNANSKTVVLDLAEGTRQTLPPEYTVLSRVSRNMQASGAGGGAIRALDSRSAMDAFMPNWQDPTVLPNSTKVVHVVHDMADPTTFYVMPGNDGTGKIEAVVGALPADVVLPTTGSPDPDLVASYTDPVDMPDIYFNALVDYVTSRAYAKDSRAAGSAARAIAHMQAFTAAVGGFAATETGMSLATHASTNQQAREK